MPKLEEEPLVLLQLRLYESDVKAIKSLYGSTLGMNKAVRVIVRTFLRQVDAKAKEEIDTDVPKIDVPPEIISSIGAAL